MARDRGLGIRVLSGRNFHSGDLAAGRQVAIVNQSFVRNVLGSRNPIGRQLRFLPSSESGTLQQDAPPAPWHEIVGVVPDIGTGIDADPRSARIYVPAAPGSVYPARMAIHVKGDPLSFAPRLRAIAAAVDPTFVIYAVLMMAVCALACMVPTRRALGVQPTNALRAEG